MKQRTITALVIIAIVLGFSAMGDIGFFALILAVLGIAAFEMYSLVKTQTKPIILLLMLVVLLASPFLTINELVSVICGYLIVLATLSVVTKWFTLDLLSLIFLISVVMMMAVYSAANIFWNFGYFAFIWVLVGNYMTDTMAYFVGMKFGKHKMIPSVSPNKTWEGSFGGYFGGLISSLLFGYFVLYVNNQVFSLDLIILVSLLIPLVSQIGDLFFSQIKRFYNIKDFGTLLPSHGGVLDRVDSLVFSLIVIMLLFNVYGIFL